jgi:hypothetical protein
MPEHPDDDFRPDPEDAEAILTPLGRLKRGSSVRRFTLQLLQGRSIETIQPFISALQIPPRWQWNEREVAAWALGYLRGTEEEMDAATTALLDTLENRRTFKFWRRAVLRPFMCALPAALLGAFIVSERSYSNPFEVFTMMTFTLGLSLATVVTPASLLYDLNGLGRTRAAAADSLRRIGSPECIGALAEALYDGDRRVRDAAAYALHSILPTLSEKDYGRFGAESMRNLGRTLSHPDSRLAFKVLEVLEKVGTSHAIPFVQNAAERGRTVRLRDAAEHVLQILKERQQREGQKDRLLRSTTAPTDASAVLLRPAREAAEQEISYLLRATGSEDV